jgi:hypothetical protein
MAQSSAFASNRSSSSPSRVAARGPARKATRSPAPGALAAVVSPRIPSRSRSIDKIGITIATLADTEHIARPRLEAAQQADPRIGDVRGRGAMPRAHRLIDELDTGMMGLNTGLVSNAAAPFGGVKQSGLGREGGLEGIADTSRPSTR